MFLPFWGPDPPPLPIPGWHGRKSTSQVVPHLGPWHLAPGHAQHPGIYCCTLLSLSPFPPHPIPGEPLTCPVQMMLRLTGLFLLLLLPSPTSPRAAERAPGRAHNPNGKFLECDVIVLGKRFPISPGKSDPFWQPGRRKTRFVLQILSPSRRDTPRI